MVDLYGQVAEDLSVFGQIEVLQAVLLLARGTLLQELLERGKHGGKTQQKQNFLL